MKLVESIAECEREERGSKYKLIEWWGSACFSVVAWGISSLHKESWNELIPWFDRKFDGNIRLEVTFSIFFGSNQVWFSPVFPWGMKKLTAEIGYGPPVWPSQSTCLDPTCLPPLLFGLRLATPNKHVWCIIFPCIYNKNGTRCTLIFFNYTPLKTKKKKKMLDVFLLFFI